MGIGVSLLPIPPLLGNQKERKVMTEVVVDIKAARKKRIEAAPAGKRRKIVVVVAAATSAIRMLQSRKKSIGVSLLPIPPLLGNQKERKAMTEVVAEIKAARKKRIEAAPA